jgi:UDP-N-acetylmuramate dehydrogenase
MVQTINRAGELETRGREALQFGFRRSNLEDAFVAEVELTLDAIDPTDLTRRMQSSWIVRRAAQPPSGSRAVQALIEPDGTVLADLLEAAGVKGEREGEVALSMQYPGFFIVSGSATSKEVLALLSRVTRTVEAKTGTQLQSQLKIW